MRVAVIVAFLSAGASGVIGQDNPGSVAGVVSDPTGAPFAAVEIVLTGIDVSGTYVTRAGADGHYEFTRIAPGGYRAAVRRSGIVPIGTEMAVRAGTRQTHDIRTALEARLTLGVSAASASAMRRWISGGPPPAPPPEWECTSTGARCVAPNPALIPQPLGEIIVSALAKLEGKPGSVQMSAVITTDGFLTGASVSSATSEDLAAAVLAEVSRLRWEPARLRDVPAIASATLEVRFF